MKKKKGFTLIELIAVLVILAILALIVTPLVMNIIKKARISADKRSIDAYGRSVELAIANYLLDNGDFPTDVSQLIIEYSGDRVECSTAQLNTDLSVYLAGCTVGGRSIDGYIYGKEEAATIYAAYSVGDEVRYNNVDYYVIKDSGAKESTVTLLKAEPLTVEEVNQYGVDHVNRYTSSSEGTATDQNGYGGMAYYTDTSCGYVNNGWEFSNCTPDYEKSDVKYVVDNWKNIKSPDAIEARLIEYDDFSYLGYVEYDRTPSDKIFTKTDDTPRWVYNSIYKYWTMIPVDDSYSTMIVNNDGELNLGSRIVINNVVVRPVITINKSAITN